MGLLRRHPDTPPNLKLTPEVREEIIGLRKTLYWDFNILKTLVKQIWTEKRFKGHFVICFLAFLSGRPFEYKLKKANIKAEPI